MVSREASTSSTVPHYENMCGVHKKERKRVSLTYYSAGFFFCSLVCCSFVVVVVFLSFFMEVLTSSYPDYIVLPITRGVHNKERSGWSLIRVVSYQDGHSLD